MKTKCKYFSNVWQQLLNATENPDTEKQQKQKSASPKEQKSGFEGWRGASALMNYENSRQQQKNKAEVTKSPVHEKAT